MKLSYRKDAIKALSKLPRNTMLTVRAKMEAIAKDPYGSHNNALRLSNDPGYRLRVGDWRVFYRIEDDTIEVLDVRPRGEAYK